MPKDFLPIGFVAENPMFIAVSPTLGVKTLPELIALAKKKPGEISYATTGVGRLTHLTGELLQHETGSSSCWCRIPAARHMPSAMSRPDASP